MTCVPTCVQPSPSNAHCGACHETFGSVSGFDRHRRAGECVHPRGIAGQRLDRNGVWRYEGGEERAAAHSRSRTERQGAETGSLVPRDTPGDSEAAETTRGVGWHWQSDGHGGWTSGR